MPYRVIQWSTGNVGQYALRCIIEHPELSAADFTRTIDRLWRRTSFTSLTADPLQPAHTQEADEPGKDGDHHRQRPLVGDAPAEHEVGLDAHRLEPPRGLGTTSMDHDGDVAAGRQLRDIRETRVGSPEGTAADFDDERAAHVW